MIVAFSNYSVSVWNPVFLNFLRRADDGTGPELSTVCPLEIVTSVTQVSLACDGQATFRKVANLKLCFLSLSEKIKGQAVCEFKVLPSMTIKRRGC